MDEEKTIDTYDPQKVYESLMRWIGDLPVGARRMAEPHAKRLLEMAEGKFQEWGKYRTPDLTGIADGRKLKRSAEVTRRFVLVDELGQEHKTLEITEFRQDRDSSRACTERIPTRTRYMTENGEEVGKYEGHYKIYSDPDVLEAKELNGEKTP